MNAFHVILEIGPVPFPVKDPIDHSLTCRATLELLLPQFSLSVPLLNLPGIHASLLRCNLVPERSPRIDGLLHLHYLYAWSAVPAHEVFEVENPQNQHHVLQKPEAVSVTKHLCFLESHLPHRVLLLSFNAVLRAVLDGCFFLSLGLSLLSRILRGIVIFLPSR